LLRSTTLSAASGKEGNYQLDFLPPPAKGEERVNQRSVVGVSIKRLLIDPFSLAQ
jgi:hypothetical protein